MKYLFLIALIITIAGCDNTTTTVLEHVMTVSPKTLTYAHGEDTKMISITHNCSCPFSWFISVIDSTQVLKDTSGVQDNAKVPINIDRSKLHSDTLHARLQISTYGYGTDTVFITVFK
jgi:hypothetical protein